MCVTHEVNLIIIAGFGLLLLTSPEGVDWVGVSSIFDTSITR